MRARSRLVLWALLLGLWLPALAFAQRAPRLAVIVSARTTVDSLELTEVRRIFLARQQSWKDGARVHPVNLPASSELRETFSREVLGRSTRSLAGYWNDLYFHGTQPPPVLDSERAVLLYVERTEGAIGYVSYPMAQTVTTVKIVLTVQ